MTIDLKWTLPFVLPFAVLGTLRVLWWVADAPWSEPGLAAAFSALLGMVIGAGLLGLMHDSGICLNVRIGREKE